MTKTILITGTDTGVGKTVLTALLLCHLRGQGRRALAMKPFCSGGRHDAELLLGLQNRCLTLDEVNPFYYRQPLSPWVAAKEEGGRVSFSALERKIQAVANRCDILLIEGSGGLLAPLGPNYSLADLAGAIGGRTIVVGRNKLGTINHTLLTVRYLQGVGIKGVITVLMGCKKPDLSAESNGQNLQKLMPEAGVFSLPYLGIGASKGGGIKKYEKKLKKPLHELLGVLL